MTERSFCRSSESQDWFRSLDFRIMVRKIFDTFEAFTLHSRTQHPETWCGICNRNFKDLLETHKKTHDSETWCVFCDQDFVSNKLLEIHQKTQHYETWCEICNQYFNSRKSLESHQNTDHSATWCNFCSRDLKSKDLLEIHKNSAGCRSPLPAKETSTSQWATSYCVDCKLQCKSSDHFRVHRDIMHRRRDAGNGNNQSKAQSSSSTSHQARGYCPDCKVGYFTKERLQEHTNRAHNKRSATPPPKPSWKPKQHVPPLQHHIAQNFYDRLGVSSSASQSEIGKAAKMKRIETHPDKVKREGMTDTELAAIDASAKAIGEAADVLGDEKSRKEYDKRLRSGRVK